MSRIENIEPTIDRPEFARAWRYVWEHIDRDLEAHWGSTTGRLDHTTGELVAIRFGIVPGDVVPKRGEDILHAVRRAVEAAHRPKWSKVALLPPPSTAQTALASKWLRARLKDQWPRTIQVQTFVAHDLDTLHVACRTLDLARLAGARARPTDTFPGLPVLFMGPTGVGKDLLARAFHHLSSPGAPFEALNCSALSGPLLESELWGHAKGAFTDAKEAKQGIAALAANGSIFLDEIGEMALEAQPRLLRFLNDGWYRPVGSGEQRRAFPRVLSATLSNLPARAESGSFRRDLFQRLRGYELRLPALKDRPESIEPTFLELLRARRPDAELTNSARMTVGAYEWPGNLREMRLAVDRILERELPARASVDVHDLPEWIQDAVASVVPADERATWQLGDRPPAERPQLVLRQVEHLIQGDDARRDEPALHGKIAVVQYVASAFNVADVAGKIATRATTEVYARRVDRAAKRLEVLCAAWVKADPDAATLAARIVAELRANGVTPPTDQRDWTNVPVRSALIEILWELIGLAPPELFVGIEEPLRGLMRSPVGLLLRVVSDALGDRTASQIARDFQRGRSTPSFDELRNDPKRLVAAIEQVRTLRAFARQYGVSEETVRRALPVTDRPKPGRHRRER